MHNETELLSSAAAEKYLQLSLGEPDGYWRVFLQNNRRPDRTPGHFIAFTVIRGRPHYWAADLDDFIAFHRSEELSRGKVPGTLDDALKAIGGWPTGRPFTGQVMPQVEDGSGVTFVSILLANPLLVFRLEPEQARALAADLIEAADVVDRAAGEVL